MSKYYRPKNKRELVAQIMAMRPDYRKLNKYSINQLWAMRARLIEEHERREYAHI